MKNIVFKSSVILAFIAFIFIVFFSTKIIQRNRYLENLIQVSVIDRGLTDNDDIAISISREIFRSTNRVVTRDKLDAYSRWEAFSFFNVTSGVSLKYGIYGIEGHSQLGPCGTMSRVLLNALWELQIPARKLHLLDNENFYTIMSC